MKKSLVFFASDTIQIHFSDIIIFELVDLDI